MRIIAYVDAFNFYYGLTRNTPYRWCNLSCLCELLFPNEEVDEIKVFAAYSKSFPSNPSAHLRQKSYLRALEAIPNITLHMSKFSPEDRYCPLSDPLPEKTEMVKVRFTKEKGSDVKLASHLLMDGFQNNYDMAIVFTNDSDLVTPIKFARYKLSKIVALALTTRPPNPSRPASQGLVKYANFSRLITEEMLAASQLPDRIVAPNGKLIVKPNSW